MTGKEKKRREAVVDVWEGSSFLYLFHRELADGSSRGGVFSLRAHCLSCACHDVVFSVS